MFGDIWHLKESGGSSGQGKNTQRRESRAGLPLKSLRMNNGLAEPTPGEPGGGGCTDFPTQLPVEESSCLACWRQVICPHMTGKQMLPHIRIKLATPKCSQASLAGQLGHLESGLFGLQTHCVIKASSQLRCP